MNGNNDAVTLAVVAVLASCVGGLLWVIKYLFNKFLPMLEKSNELTETNNALLVQLEKTSSSADQYLRQRNGHDDENHKEVVKVIRTIPKKMQEIADHQAKALLDSFRQVKQQHVKHQLVDHQDTKKAKDGSVK